MHTQNVYNMCADINNLFEGTINTEGETRPLNYEQVRDIVYTYLIEYNGGNRLLNTIKQRVLSGSMSFTNNTIGLVAQNIDFEPIRTFERPNGVYHIHEVFSHFIREKYKEVIYTNDKIKPDYVFDVIQVLEVSGISNGSYVLTYRFMKNMLPVCDIIPKDWVFVDSNRTISGLYTEGSEAHKKITDSRYKVYDLITEAKGRKIMDHQKIAVEFMTKHKKVILADGMGLGKPQANSTLIPMADGSFKPLGDICVGDRVFSSNNTACNVTKVFPKGKKLVYTLELSNGFHVNSTIEHDWYVKDESTFTGNFVKKSLHDIIGGREFSDNGVIVFEDSERPILPRLRPSFTLPDGDGIVSDIDPTLSIDGTHTYERNVSYERNLGICFSYLTEAHKYGHEYSFPGEEERSKMHKKFFAKYSLLKETRLPSEIYSLSRYRIFGFIDGFLNNIPGNYNSRIKRFKHTYCPMLAFDIAKLCGLLGYGVHKGKSDYFIDTKTDAKQLYVVEDGVSGSVDSPEEVICTYINSIRISHEESCTCIEVDSVDHSYITENYTVTHNTLSSIVSAVETKSDKTLIITTASLKNNWVRELKQYVNENEISVISGKKFDDSGRFVIINYDIMSKYHIVPEEVATEKKLVKQFDGTYTYVDEPIFRKTSSGKLVPKMVKSRKKEVIEKALSESPLFKNKYNCVIIDEAHKLSNNKSLRYKSIDDFLKRQKPNYVFLLSGTPLTNRPLNFYHVLKLIDAEVTQNYNYFIQRYCNSRKITLKDGRTIRINTGYSNLEELRFRTEKCYLRRVPDDIEGFPEKTINVINYDLTEKQKVEYDKLWDDYLYEKIQEGKYDVSEYRDLVERSLLRHFVAKEMTENTINVVDDIIDDENEKVIIITTTDKEIEIFKEKYKGKCVVYNGKMSEKQKDESVDKFMNDKKIQVFIGNIIACSVGLTLTSAKTLIFNSCSYVPADNWQAEDRICRLGQKNKCLVIYQFYDDKISQDLLNKIEEKRHIIKSTIKTETEKQAKPVYHTDLFDNLEGV